MLPKILSLSTLLSAIILVVLLRTTSPATVHPVAILLVFILIYVFVLGVLTFLLYMGGRVLRLVPFFGDKASLTMRRAYYYASVLATTPVIVVGMMSIGRAGVYELVLVAVFEAVVCFYIAKRR